MPMIATAFGPTIAAPIPANALAILKSIKLFVANPITNDQIVHQMPPRRSTFLCPYTAPMRPLTRMNAP